MKLLKILPAVLAGATFLPAHADGVGRSDNSASKQIAIDLKSCDKPVWPRESLRNEETGAVVLEFLIGLDGSVLQSKVAQSSGHPMLDLAAQDGLAKCRFTPPSSVGRSEPTWTKMKYVWTLEGRKSPAEKLAAWQADLAAAEQGDAAAQYRLAVGYRMGTPDGQRDMTQALRWLRASAEQGYGKAQEGLASELMSGQNVGRDPAGAVALLEQAAAQGSSTAQFHLALVLQRGLGVPQDLPRARQVLEQANSGGNLDAKAMLGDLLLAEGGDSQARAVQLLQEAAERHQRYAQFLLGQAYENGNGVARDEAHAQALYERAAAGGVPMARAALQRLKGQ